MTPINDTHVKDPDASLPYEWDWAAWLSDGETITGTVITADPGITVGAPSQAAGIVTVRVSGGTAGATYRVACRITTSGGNIDERTKKIVVRNR
ncbi:MAG: hypothetical protein IPI21_13860 [Propionivibrio sp.]|nr:hypothetical protein [Propionivibrio sp.]